MVDEIPPTTAANATLPRRKGGTLISASRNSLDGLRVLIQERAARRELLLIAATGVVYALWPTLHTLMLLVLAFVLLAVEALNTAIEVLCDHVTPEIHPAIKKAKDLGSVAIFIICCAMVLVAVLALAHFCGLLNHR